MESLEVLVWVFFVGAVVIFNLVQQWQRKARRRLEEMQAQSQPQSQPQTQGQGQGPGQAGAARTGAPATLPAQYQPQSQPQPPRRTPFGAEPWGRAPDRVALEEEWLETQARPLPVEVLPQPPLPVPLAARTPPPPTPRLVPAVHTPRQRPFRTAREVRQGIVAMTVLGPCRALDPYEPTQAEPPRS